MFSAIVIFAGREGVSSVLWQMWSVQRCLVCSVVLRSIFPHSAGVGGQYSVTFRLFFCSIGGGLGCIGGSVLPGGCCSCGPVLLFYSGGCVLVGFCIHLVGGCRGEVLVRLCICRGW